MNILGKKVVLTAIEKDDMSKLHLWANDPDIQRNIGGWHFPTNGNDQEKWFESLNINSKNQRFAIRASESGIIGTVSLVEINWKDRNAFYGITIGESTNRGKGYAVDTNMAMMRYAFDELGLNRIDTTIIEYNLASINLFVHRSGWKQEGLQKEWYFRDGRFWDRLIIGITRAEYKEFISKNNYWLE